MIVQETIFKIQQESGVKLLFDMTITLPFSGKLTGEVVKPRETGVGQVFVIL
jgi:hypothetical protein